MNFWEQLTYDPDLERAQLQNELLKLNLENEKRNRANALNAYDKYRDNENTLDQAQDIAGSVNDNLAATLNGQQKNADITPENVRNGSVYMGPYNLHAMSDIAEALNKPKLERMSDYDLPRYAAYDDGIASALNQANKQESQDLLRDKMQSSTKQSDFERKLGYIKNMNEELGLGLTSKQMYDMATANGAVLGMSDAAIKAAADKAAAQAAATSPIQTQTAANTEAARSDIEALTPAFIADRQKEWSAETKPYAEVIQNYAFAKSGTGGAIDDVALIKALEKVREPGSAVMFGDAEIWRKAGNAFDKAAEGGILDALKSGATKRLPDVYRAQLVALLENAMNTARQKMEQKRQAYADVARADYGWDDARINRIYKIPSVSIGSGGGSKNMSTSRPPLSSFKR